MATEKQKKAVENLVGNGGNVTKAMRDASYSENTFNTPQKLTESKGFKELCEEKGLTDELLLSSLVSDIKSKKKNRKAEIELGFKVKGRLRDDPNPIQNNYFFNLTDEQKQRIARRLVSIYRTSEE